LLRDQAACLLGRTTGLRIVLPDPKEQTTGEHIRLVLAALEGAEHVLRVQRDDITLVSWATCGNPPEVFEKFVAAREADRAGPMIGESRLRFWAWRVAFPATRS